jgi:hypothetical protein
MFSLRLICAALTTAVALGAGAYHVAAEGDLRARRAAMTGTSMAGPQGQAPATNARAILDRAIAAKGGEPALRAIKTIVMRGTMVVTGPKPVTAETTSYIEYPDRFRQDARLPSGEVTQVYAAGDAWVKDQAGVHDPPAPENLAAAVSRDIIALLLGAADGRLGVDVVPEQGQRLSRPADVLRVTGASMAPVDLFVDRASGAIAGKRYTVQQPGSIGKVPTEEWYSDYRSVGGVQVAFKTVVRRGEATILEQTLTDFRLNAPIDRNVFTRPAK